MPTVNKVHVAISKGTHKRVEYEFPYLNALIPMGEHTLDLMLLLTSVTYDLSPSRWWATSCTTGT